MTAGTDTRLSGYYYRDPQQRQAHIDAVYEYCQRHLVAFTAQVRMRTASPANLYALLSPERIAFTERRELLEGEVEMVCAKLGHRALLVVDLEAPPERALLTVEPSGRLSGHGLPLHEL